MNWKTPQKRKSIPRLLSVIVVTMSEKVKSFKRRLLHKRSKSKGICLEGYPEKYHFLLFSAFTINPTEGILYAQASIWAVGVPQRHFL